MYESDLNFTLMPAIEALLKPDDDDGPKQRKPASSYRRRHNQDLCYACSGGHGELICCDKCPASFHLECLDPPLDEVPTGRWLCKTCKVANVKKPALVKSGSVDSRMEISIATARPSTPLGQLDEDLPLAIGLARKIFPKRSNSEAPQRLSLSVERKTSPDSLISPWDQLVKQASKTNPRKFELPKDLCVHQLFPGDDKVDVNKNGKNSKSFKSTNGSTSSATNTPLPSKSCFSCKRTCRKAPLISCDFCPLLFHQDCLDPPMTALPTTMWMCPVHPHQMADWKNISSMAVTERVKLWSTFNPPVEQDTVKAQFLRRVHSDRLKARFKLKPQIRDRAQIPPMVQYHYQNPVPLLVSMKNLHRLREVDNRVAPSQSTEGNDIQNAADEDLEVINGDVAGLANSNGTETPTDVEVKANQGKQRDPNELMKDFQEKMNNHTDLMGILRMYKDDGKLDDLLKELQDSVKSNDSSAKDEAKFNHRLLLKRRRPSGGASEMIRSRALITPIVGNPLESTPPRPILERSIPMRYRKLTIGTLQVNDLVLDGRCPQQSEKHAIIFFDDFTRSFELLNYSEHGTEVNGQLFSLNFNAAAANSDAAKDKKRGREKEEILELVTEIIDKKRGIKRIKYGHLDKGTEMAAPDDSPKNVFCNCGWRPPLTAGWEGSAVLDHGYLLNFGCESFVFSIPEPMNSDE